MSTMNPADKSPRSLKGLLLEMKLSEHHELRVLAEEQIINMFKDLQQELDAARADAKKNQIILDNLRDAPYWELQKQLADAKAQIADYESALEKIAGPKINAPRVDGYLTSDELRELANDILNKWRAK